MLDSDDERHRTFEQYPVMNRKPVEFAQCSCKRGATIKTKKDVQQCSRHAEQVLWLKPED